MKQQMDLYTTILPVLHSKIREFKSYGNNDISVDNLWEYCINEKWQTIQKETLPLHKIVATIFNITLFEITYYMVKKEQRNFDGLVEISKEELQFLLQTEFQHN